MIWIEGRRQSHRHGQQMLQMEKLFHVLYTKAGTHTYTVAEKLAMKKNVALTTVHTVTVEVADNGQGKWVSTITGNKPAFVNMHQLHRQLQIHNNQLQPLQLFKQTRCDW